MNNRAGRAVDGCGNPRLRSRLELNCGFIRNTD